MKRKILICEQNCTATQGVDMTRQTRGNIIGIIGIVFILLMVGMAVKNARGAEATTDKWRISIVIEKADGSAVADFTWHGTDGPPTRFATEALCKNYLTTNELLALAVARVLAIAARHGDTVQKIGCVEEDPGDNI